MKGVFLFIFFSFINALFSLSAESYEGEIFFNENIEIVSSGDILSATLKIYPVEENERILFYSLIGKNIEKKILILEVESIEPNENNVDILDIKGLFVVLKDFDTKSGIILDAAGEKVPIKLKLKKINKTELKEKEYIIVSQSKKDLPLSIISKSLITLASLTVAYLLFILLYKYFCSRKKKKEKKKILNKWNDLFKSAETREEFEAIYLQRENWISILETTTQPTIHFIEMMHEHQYKRVWSDLEHQIIKNAFCDIRGIFK